MLKRRSAVPPRIASIGSPHTQQPEAPAVKKNSLGPGFNPRCVPYLIDGVRGLESSEDLILTGGDGCYNAKIR